MITFDYDKSYRKGRLICDDSILTFVRNHFSEKDASASFVNHKAKSLGKKSKIPDRKYAIQASGLFDFGLFVDIRKFLISESISEITYTDNFKECLMCGFKDYELFDGLKYPLRDYQVETVETCLKVGRGTVVVATGGGKSLIQASLIENWKKIKGNVKCLLVVPGTGLVHQLLNDFKEYEVSFTFSGWTGETDTKGNYKLPLTDTEVIIVNTECLCSQFGNFTNLLDVDLVLRDECHQTKLGNVMTKILSKIKTPNKFGFTGTLPKEKIDVWKIIGTFGPIIYEKNSKELRDAKFLAHATIRVIKLIHKHPPRGYKKELEFIHTDETRNNTIRKIVSKLNKNILILVNRLEHGEHLSEHLKFDDKEFYFVSGAMPVLERMAIIERMESQDNIVCVAMASIFSTGINVKNLHYVMFAGNGKSFVRIVQSIGRGLRLHHSKDLLTIFDLYDNMKSSTEHADLRKTFYDDEQIPWKETELNLSSK
jgi:superfamily II DNA or RNA helicase